MARGEQSLRLKVPVCVHPIVACLAFVFSTSLISGAQNASVPSPAGKLIDVHGRKLHLNCSGKGSPTVLLEAGLGDSSLVWSLVQPKLSAQMRACSHDRAGTAWSHDAGPQHSLSQAADDLDALITNAGERPPYILVGHSWGGWLITVYARRHPDKVRGIVLLDSSVGFDPPVIEKMPEGQAGGPPSGPMKIKKTPSESDAVFRRLPASAYREYLWAESLPRLEDVDNPDEPLATVQAATTGTFPLGNIPLVLIAARNSDAAMDQETEKGKNIRSKILALSRDSALLYANTGHHVQIEDPDLVVSAIRQVIAKASHVQQ
jgi:pimeloyl-ACP methyl ester carboxylesterase